MRKRMAQIEHRQVKSEEREHLTPTHTFYCVSNGRGGKSEKSKMLCVYTH